MKFTIFIPFFITIFIQGCAIFTGYENDLINFNQDITYKNCQNLEYYEENFTKDPILMTNQAGSLAQICNDFKTSNKFFDIAEQNYKNIDLENIFSQSFTEISKFLLNDNIANYDGKFYERIMNNYYKALNYLNIGDFSGARVEFNRILNRQERAKNHFASYIKKMQNQLNKTKSELLNDEILQDFISKNRPKNQQILPNFINSFASYFGAIFFLCEGDLNKGENLLRQIAKFYPQNRQILQDLQNAKLLSRDKKIIWILYENGKSIGLVDKKFTFPIMVDDQMLFLNFSFAFLSQSAKNGNFLQVNGKKTKIITDMDDIIRAEFNATFDFKMTKTIINSLSKMILQYEITRQTGGIGGILTGLFYVMSNKSDVRYWSYLPQNFQSLSFVNVGENFKIKDKFNNDIGEFNIPKNKNAIIYIKDISDNEKFISKILF